MKPDVHVIWKPNKGPQTEVLQRREREILFGGARGGGKTDAGMAWLLRWIDNPKYRALIIRLNEKDLRDWIERARIMYAGTGAKFAYRPTEIRFPSGSIFYTGHLNDENAYTQYQGHEYHKMLIEELTHIPSEELYLKLLASNRSTVDGLSPQVFATTNPTESGHLWVKKRFVDVAEPGCPYYEHDKATKLTLSRIFIPAKVEDNPVLMEQDPEYVAMLNRLPDDLRRAWRDGSWDVQEIKGAYYAENMQQCVREGRICTLEYEPQIPVQVAWDLGGDTMCVWCIQCVAREIHFIKFMHGEGGGIAGYIKTLRSMYPDNLGKMYFPHDIETRDPSYNRTRISLVEELGIHDYALIPRQDPSERRNAMKMLFPRFWFSEKEEYGIQALWQYRREWNDQRQIFMEKHLDNWAAHVADAAGCFAQGFEDMSKVKIRRLPVYSPRSSLL